MNQLTIQHDHGAVIEVPLNKLKASPRNARKTPHAHADIEALAQSIAAKGVIQPLVVEPETDAQGATTGFFLVTVGEGRRQALWLRAKRKEISRRFPVRCVVDTANDPFEVSLDENVTRFAMHPADQFDAFQRLAEDRHLGPEEIAARFGGTPTVVRQRLRLAAVSPKLMALYRQGELSLDQLMVFTITDDHAHQEATWESLSWNTEPSYIRRALTQDRVRATERRAVFVGEASYVEAGGVIERDLFGDDQGGYFADVALLDRLVLQRLGEVADEVAGEGWKWVSASLEPASTFQLARVYPHRIALSAEDQVRSEALDAEGDALETAYEAGGDPDRLLAQRFDVLSSERSAFEPARLAYRPEDVARAGAFITLASDGTARVERGFVRKEDEVAAEPDAEEDDSAPEPDGAPERTPRLSDRLVADLTAHRTAALCDQLAQHPEMALAALTHEMAAQTFRRHGGRPCLEIKAGGVHLQQYAADIGETPASGAVEARQAAWEAELPDDADQLWFAILAMDAPRQLALLAHCVAMTVNAVQSTHRPGRSPTFADRLASALKLDMAAYWRPTRESYLGRVTKPAILEAVREAVSDDAARRIEGLKKDAMAESAEQLLASTNWVPESLRTEAGQVIEAPSSDEG